jgi:hypothetical protein
MLQNALALRRAALARRADSARVVASRARSVSVHAAQRQDVLLCR